MRKKITFFVAALMLTQSLNGITPQKAAAAERRKKERQIAQTEEEIAALEAQQAEMEQLLALQQYKHRRAATCGPPESDAGSRRGTGPRPTVLS